MPDAGCTLPTNIPIPVEMKQTKIYIPMGLFNGVDLRTPSSLFIAILASQVRETMIRRRSSTLTTTSLPGASASFISGERSMLKMRSISPISGFTNVTMATASPRLRKRGSFGEIPGINLPTKREIKRMMRRRSINLPLTIILDYA